MTLQPKKIRLAMGAALLVLTAGCSGINASKSVSPLDFFLPGLIKTSPATMPTNQVAPEIVSVKQIALAR